jgi:hypothetical protein
VRELLLKIFFDHELVLILHPVVKVNNNQKRKENFISNKYSNFQRLVDSVGGIEEVFEEE